MAKKNSQDQAPEVTNPAVTNPFEGKSPEEIQEILKKAQEDLKALKALAKGEKPKKEKTIKGQMVSFTNKAGETITGMGTRYYVVRKGGKLHYKAEDQVHVLTPEEIEALPKDEIVE